MPETLLIASLAGLAYVYVGYPLCVWLLSRWRPRVVRRGPDRPSVTILIPAHNERADIATTIENKLALDYDAGRVEIIVISDASTDGTDEIVEAYADRGVRLIRQEPRQGKTAALNLAAAEARGEILVFSDANSIYEPQALARLVENFADDDVGYTTGKMIYVRPDGNVTGDGCSAYMRYENRLRTAESRFGSIVGVDGGIDAMRRSLYEPMRPDQLPDFVLPLSVVAGHHRVVYEPRAVLRETALDSSRDEYRMRVRVALRALWAMHDMRLLLNVTRYGWYSWQLVSHKILRYGAFLMLLVAFASNAVVAARGGIWMLSMAGQLTCYGLAMASWLLERGHIRVGLLYVPYYFTLVNLASAHAFLKYLTGHKQVLWTPRRG